MPPSVALDAVTLTLVGAVTVGSTTDATGVTVTLADTAPVPAAFTARSCTV
jgi:hypothetical protein